MVEGGMKCRKWKFWKFSCWRGRDVVMSLGGVAKYHMLGV